MITQNVLKNGSSAFCKELKHRISNAIKTNTNTAKSGNNFGLSCNKRKKDEFKKTSTKLKYLEELPAEIAQSIKQAKALSEKKDLMIFDNLLPYPAQFSYITKDITRPGFKFYNSLKVNKQKLIKDLEIDEKIYDTCAEVAMKIAQNESKLGTSSKFKFYNALKSNNIILTIGSNIRKFFKGDGDLSLGITQFKISKTTNKEKELFRKYGITFENNRSNILKPEKSAIATMIHLAELYKDYPKYLQEIYAIRPNTYRVTIKKSIQNARKILFDKDKRPDALNALTGILHAKDTQPAGMTTMAEFADVTTKDLNDLRTYASTVVLSPRAYLAARWNGRKVIPSGEGCNIACKNLLNLIAQKGYIANVDKTSKVLY